MAAFCSACPQSDVLSTPGPPTAVDFAVPQRTARQRLERASAMLAAADVRPALTARTAGAAVALPRIPAPRRPGIHTRSNA